MKEYALYKGEEILAIGTTSEIAKKMGVNKKTIIHYKTPAYHKRLIKRNAINRNVRILIPLDEEDDE